MEKETMISVLKKTKKNSCKILKLPNKKFNANLKENIISSNFAM